MTEILRRFQCLRQFQLVVQKSAAETTYELDNENFKAEIGDELYDQLVDDTELLDGASEPFDQELVDKGELSPVFFGSALTTFGIETFLEHF